MNGEVARIAVSGATGLVGSALVERLNQLERQVIRLTRSRLIAAEREDSVFWDPLINQVDVERLEELKPEAVVHLAGESIQGRWSEEKKKEILRSREEGTRLLAKTLASMENRPSLLISASAVGYYGNRGEEELSEESDPGYTFLAEVAKRWEAACQPAREAGIRVVNLRIGMVLSRRGGALAKLIPPFRLGLGGRVGSGLQWWSWISLVDLVDIILFLLLRSDTQGPINAVSPQPVRNVEFTRELARILRRPAILPLPEFMVRLLFGQMGEELLLASTRALPQRLEELGFSFRLPTLADALEYHLFEEAAA